MSSLHEGGIFDVILVAFWPAADFYFIVSLVKEIKLLQIYLALIESLPFSSADDINFLRRAQLM